MRPEQEEQVRRALAAAAQRDDRVTMPPEVAERLDGVLAELVASRRETTQDTEATGSPQAAPEGDELARRRRRWPTVMAAAAAVAVIALGGGVAVLRSLAGGTAQNDSPGAAGAPQADSGMRKAASPGEESGSAPQGADAFGSRPPAVPELRSTRLRADVQRLLSHRALAQAPRDDLLAPSPSASGPAPAATCDRPATMPGDRVLAVRLDREPATLVVRDTQDGTREALVYSCDQPGRPAATAPLP